jgi:SAM-dependent methyltransferase
VSIEQAYNRYYPVLEDGWRFRDGTRLFYEWIRSTPNLSQAKVLNVGAGATPREERRRLRGQVGQLVGVDIDPLVLSNTDLDDAQVTDGVTLAFPSKSFDLAYSDWTLEHVERPLQLLVEVGRVLKPGAEFMFRTTNRGHYVTCVSAHTPHWFHTLTANRARQLDRAAPAPSRTFYRINSPVRVRQTLAAAGFDHVDVRLIEPPPRYLSFSTTAFKIGVAYERVVNRWNMLSGLRLIMLARARVAHMPDDSKP